MPIAEKSARKYVGDGKLPNLYWVSIHGDWLTNKKSGDCYDWAGDTYETFKPPKTLTFGPFKTYAEALDCLNRETWRLTEPTEEEGDYHGATIEDRISGEVFESIYIETYSTRKYRGTTLRERSITYENHDETDFTRRKLGADFQ